MERPVVVFYILDAPAANGPFGAREVGQGPVLPVPPAVVNAVYDAVGARVDEIPVTPEKILKALASPAKRHGPRGVPDVTWPEPIRVPTPWEAGTAPMAAPGRAAGSRAAPITREPRP